MEAAAAAMELNEPPHCAIAVEPNTAISKDKAPTMLPFFPIDLTVIFLISSLLILVIESFSIDGKTRFAGVYKTLARSKKFVYNRAIRMC